jgi:hypothetical protein
MQVDFLSFQCVIFKCKWRDTFNQSNVKECNDNGLICINSKTTWDENELMFFQNTTTNFFNLDILDRFMVHTKTQFDIKTCF